MPYDPERHHRQSIRLPGYDYAQPGAYFVTVCVRNRECILGSVEDGRVGLSGLGEIVEACWRSLPRHFPNLALDAFVVMPNHVHGIITILSPDCADTSAGAQHAAPLQPTPHPAPLHPGTSPGSTPRHNVTPGSLGAMVRSFKAAVSRETRAHWDVSFPLWQRNYHERVIRNEKELQRIQEYIISNPAQWAVDRENPVAG